jgi:hypothetical protein
VLSTTTVVPHIVTPAVPQMLAPASVAAEMFHTRPIDLEDYETSSDSDEDDSDNEFGNNIDKDSKLNKFYESPVEQFNFMNSRFHLHEFTKLKS